MEQQAARTYLERNFEKFDNETAEGLISHGLQALTASLQDGELEEDSCSIAVVGQDTSFKILEGEHLRPYLEALKQDVGKVLSSILPILLCQSSA